MHDNSCNFEPTVVFMGYRYLQVDVKPAQTGRLNSV